MTLTYLYFKTRMLSLSSTVQSYSRKQVPKICASVKESRAITCLYRAHLWYVDCHRTWSTRIRVSSRRICPSTKRGFVSASFPPISRIFDRGRTFRRYYSRHRTVKGRKFLGAQMLKLDNFKHSRRFYFAYRHDPITV